MIDTRFLKIHPRTELWFEQRKQCEQCANMERVGTTMMKCTKLRGGGGGPSRMLRLDRSCLHARDPGPAQCGPEARFFEEASCAAK